MKKSNISVIIFTSNSAAVVAQSIKSAAFADEVIVFDSGSTDDTVKIAKKMVKKVIEIPYLPYVEPQREMALKQVNHDWVLFLDADEEAPENVEKIIEQVQASDAVVANLPRKNMMFNQWIQHSGYWPDRHPRLFQKGKVTWHAEIHSKPTIHGNAWDVPAEEGNALVHHHYTSISEWIRRMDRYTSVKVREMQDEPFAWNHVITKPLAEFLRRYFAWEGYKDGLHGLTIALLDGVYALMIVLKHWETKKFVEPKEPVRLVQVEKEFLVVQKELMYWFQEIAMKSAKTQGEKLLLKVKRKLKI